MFAAKDESQNKIQNTNISQMDSQTHWKEERAKIIQGYLQSIESNNRNVLRENKQDNYGPRKYCQGWRPARMKWAQSEREANRCLGSWTQTRRRDCLCILSGRTVATAVLRLCVCMTAGSEAFLQLCINFSLFPSLSHVGAILNQSLIASGASTESRSVKFISVFW